MHVKFALCLALAFGGCKKTIQQQQASDLLTLQNKQRAPVFRARAYQRLPIDIVDGWQYILSPQVPFELRLAFLERLYAHAPEQFWQRAQYEWRFLDDLAWHWMCEQLQQTPSPTMRKALFMAWAYRGEGVTSPEALALDVMEAAPIMDIVLQQFMSQDESLVGASWQIILREAPSISEALLTQSTFETELARAIAAWYAQTQQYVTGHEGPGHFEWVRHWYKQQDSLGSAPGMHLRHLVLATLPQAQVSLSTHLSAMPPVLRTHVGVYAKPPERADIDIYHPLDVEIASHVVQALAQDELREALLQHAILDIANTQTELGGLLRVDSDSNIYFQPYRPVVTGNNRAYVAPITLWQDLIQNGLCHVHFHATGNWQNNEFSGPGEADLAMATRYDIQGIVLTPVARGCLNVDLYLPDKKVIDLGVFNAQGWLTQVP